MKKIPSISEFTGFIDKELMPHQLKYSLYLVGGLIALIIILVVFN